MAQATAKRKTPDTETETEVFDIHWLRKHTYHPPTLFIYTTDKDGKVIPENSERDFEFWAKLWPFYRVLDDKTQCNTYDLNVPDKPGYYWYLDDDLDSMGYQTKFHLNIPEGEPQYQIIPQFVMAATHKRLIEVLGYVPAYSVQEASTIYWVSEK
jgi:hypothetical protein